jgi:hypothetical protein
MHQGVQPRTPRGEAGHGGRARDVDAAGGHLVHVETRHGGGMNDARDARRVDLCERVGIPQVATRADQIAREAPGKTLGPLRQLGRRARMHPGGHRQVRGETTRGDLRPEVAVGAGDQYTSHDSTSGAGQRAGSLP